MPKSGNFSPAFLGSLTPAATLVLGGALSDDKAHRKAHESWWPQEEWSDEERIKCIERIERIKGKVDYVLSHTGTTKGIASLDAYYENDENIAELRRDSTVVFNDKVESMIVYKKWFFGTATGDTIIILQVNMCLYTIWESFFSEINLFIVFSNFQY